MKALIWNELQQIGWLWLIFSGLIYLLIPLTGGTDVAYLGISFVYLFLLAGFMGSRAFAGEKERGTFDYLRTLPIQPYRILIMKYFIGLIQIVILVFLIAFLMKEPVSFAKDAQVNDIPITLVSQFVFVSFTYCFICFYSLFFLASLFANDTVRSFLIGFVCCLLFGSIIGAIHYFTIPRLHQLLPLNYILIKGIFELWIAFFFSI